jgi:hypothetical protein
LKGILSRFLGERVEEGTIDAEAAVFVARHWLHDTAAGLHGDRSAEVVF